MAFERVMAAIKKLKPAEKLIEDLPGRTLHSVSVPHPHANGTVTYTEKVFTAPIGRSYQLMQKVSQVNMTPLRENVIINNIAKYVHDASRGSLLGKNVAELKLQAHTKSIAQYGPKARAALAKGYTKALEMYKAASADGEYAAKIKSTVERLLRAKYAPANIVNHAESLNDLKTIQKLRPENLPMVARNAKNMSSPELTKKYIKGAANTETVLAGIRASLKD